MIRQQSYKTRHSPDWNRSNDTEYEIQSPLSRTGDTIINHHDTQLARRTLTIQYTVNL